MKKFENTFAVTGFVGKDAEIRQFTNATGYVQMTNPQNSTASNQKYKEVNLR